jgi:hypothetical protein
MLTELNRARERAALEHSPDVAALITSSELKIALTVLGRHRSILTRTLRHWKVTLSGHKEQTMWCSECKREHTPQELCDSCGTCLLGEHSHPHDDEEYCIRLVKCIVCNALNTIEYNTVEQPPEDGPPTVQELEKTFDEHWGTEGEVDEYFTDDFLGAENSIGSL